MKPQSPQGETIWRKAAALYLHSRLSSVEHTGDTEEFPKAADLTDDQLAAIVAGAKLTVVNSLAGC